MPQKQDTLPSLTISFTHSSSASMNMRTHIHTYTFTPGGNLASLILLLTFLGGGRKPQNPEQPQSKTQTNILSEEILCSYSVIKLWGP